MKKSKEKIIQSAIQLLKQDKSVSLEEIAKHSGVSRSTLHRHFTGRTELVKTVFDVMGKGYVEGLTDVILSNPDPLARLFDLFKYDLGAYQDLIVFESLYKDHDRGKALDPKLLIQIQQGHHLVFESLIKEKVCRQDITAELLDIYYRSQLDFVMRMNKRGLYNADTLPLVWEIFWNGISNSEIKK